MAEQPNGEVSRVPGERLVKLTPQPEALTAKLRASLANGTESSQGVLQSLAKRTPKTPDNSQRGKGESGSTKLRILDTAAVVGMAGLLGFAALRGGVSPHHGAENDRPSHGFTGTSGEILSTDQKLTGGREVVITGGKPKLLIKNWGVIGGSEKDIVAVGDVVAGDSSSDGSIPTLLLSKAEGTADYDKLAQVTSLTGDKTISYSNLKGVIGTEDDLKNPKTKVGKLFDKLVHGNDRKKVLAMLEGATKGTDPTQPILLATGGQQE